MNKIISLLFILIISFIHQGKSQLHQPWFFIYRSPVTIKQKTIDSINRIIALDSDEENVFFTIDNALKSNPGTIIMVKRYMTPPLSQHYKYSIGRPDLTIRSLVTENTGRNPDDELITNDQQFKKFFGDTLYVIDTLVFNINLPWDYYINTPDLEMSLSQSGKQAFLYPKKNNDKQYHVILKSKHSAQVLADVQLIFLNNDTKTILTADKNLFLSISGPIQADEKKIFAKLLSEIFQLQYGPIKPTNILHWFNSNY